MIVSQATFHSTIDMLMGERRLGLDTETLGLRMFHGDRLFSIIIATAHEAYYFNFNYREDHLGNKAPLDNTFPPGWLMHFHPLFDDINKIWFIQNAGCFDLPVLGREGFELKGTVHCTKVIARVVRNDLQNYSLAALLPAIGLSKDMRVDEYITKHQLYDTIKPPGKNQKIKLIHMEKVPFELITEYGEKDGTGVYHLGVNQEKRILEMDLAEPELVRTGRSLTNVMENERRFVKTIARMKTVGVQIDRPYCERAAAFELDRMNKGAVQFKIETGRDFIASGKLFQEVFKDEKDKWKKTPKGNPSFDADVLATFASPAARAVVAMRDAKAKADFYNGFLYHADSRGAVHPDFNSSGTVHGRLSSSEPNFQNLSNEDDDEEAQSGEFMVRRAIIPRPGFVLIMPDYNQMEYKFALEMACRVAGRKTAFAELVASGFDFHDATKQRVFEVAGLDIPRKPIKTANFLTLYGGGVGKLASALGISYPEAREIRAAIKSAAPEINEYITQIMAIAEQRKYIVNWFGRRSHFVYRSMAYKAPNYHISGGCADIVKIAMNKIDALLLDRPSRMIMTVHDELPIEIHESELIGLPQKVHEIMESTFISKYVPLTVGMAWSSKSLGDKIKGYPV